MDQPRRVSRAVDRHAINETPSMHRLYRTVCHVRAVISAKQRLSWPYNYFLMLHDLSVAFPSFHVRFSADGPSLPMSWFTVITQHRPCRVGSVGVGQWTSVGCQRRSDLARWAPTGSSSTMRQRNARASSGVAASRMETTLRRWRSVRLHVRHSMSVPCGLSPAACFSGGLQPMSGQVCALHVMWLRRLRQPLQLQEGSRPGMLLCQWVRQAFRMHV